MNRVKTNNPLRGLKNKFLNKEVVYTDLPNDILGVAFDVVKKHSFEYGNEFQVKIKTPNGNVLIIDSSSLSVKGKSQ